MTTATQNTTDIQAILEQLGVEAQNYGASTGAQWIKTSGAQIDSISPVDA